MPSFSEILDHFLTEFDKTPTLAIVGFEIFVVIAAAAGLVIMSMYKDRILPRFWIVAIGVVIFEIFTAPMWNNYKMGFWAYVYRDVSWILTIGWATMILGTVVLVDYVFPQYKQWQRFIGYLAILVVLVAIFESIVVAIGIRSYSPEVLAVIEGSYFPFLNVPAHLLYYVPVFTSLVIGFYKYWGLFIEDESSPSPVRGHWLRVLIISFIAVFAFEIMIEPMVVNAKLPSWSYLYRDISFLMTFGWIIGIWLSITLVDRFLPRLTTPKRFVSYLVVLTVIVFPIEAVLIKSGIRVYGASAQENFSGFTTIIADLPIEVLFAVPLYMALVVGFILYWERVSTSNAHQGENQ